MELIKGKEFISQKLNWLHKGGLKAIEKVTGDESILNQETAQDQNQGVIQGQNVSQDGTVTTNVDQNNVPPPVTGTTEVKKSEETEEFDDELLWSKQYCYDEFIDSLSHEYEERGNKEEEKRHWNYPRRWMVRLFNLKIINLTTENFSCFAEFDFGGSRNECRVQIGSNNYILNSGKSKNYIRTPVLKNVEKDSSRSFDCTHSFEYRGSYLDLENEKLRIKVWKCNTYTINTLESIYEELLIKFAEGDEHVDIMMYKYVGGQKKLTCRLSFNLFFQELYDFEINMINFKIQNVISSYYLFNYQRLHLSKLTNGPRGSGSNDNKENDDMKDWNMINKLKYSIFKFKMERKMSKINAKGQKKTREELDEDLEEEDEEETDNQQSEPNTDVSNPESEMSSPKNKEEVSKNNDPKSSKKTKDKRKEEKLLKKKEKREEVKKNKEMKNKGKNKKRMVKLKGGKKQNIGVGFVTSEEDRKNRDTTLVFMSKNKEYISILRENTQLFVQIGTFVSFECKLPPSPRLSIKLKTSGTYLKKMGLMSHSVRNAFSCEWDNLGEIQFRGTISELSNSFLEIKLLDWSAPKAANCIGMAIIPLESVVDYPFISSKLYAPEWLRLKSQYEGWGDKLPDLQLGTVSGSLIINRKPRYRQIRGYNNVTSSNQLLIIHINNIDQLLVNTQEKVNSFVEVSFNNFITRTNMCKDMLGPIYNEELYIPIQNDMFGSSGNNNAMADYDELLGMGSIRITVWGYVMDKLNYFGSCVIGIREIFFNKNVLRPLSKKTHNLGDNFKYETTYETRVYNTTKKIYHYLYNEQDNISNINLSVWFFPLVPIKPNTNKISTSIPVLPKVGANVNLIREQIAKENKELQGEKEEGQKLEELSEEDKINKLSEIWKRICLITNNEHFIDYYYFFDQFGIKMFASSFVQVLHPPPSVETLNHIFHFVSCISFTNKNLQNVFSIDFLLKLKNGHVLDHCLLLCSFLVNNYNNVYVAIGQQKDKRYNAFVIQICGSENSIDTDVIIEEEKEKMENESTGNNNNKEDKEKVGEDQLIIYDLIVNKVIKINLKNISNINNNNKEDKKNDDIKREDLLGKDWVKKEMRKLNFVSINILFNNKNIWLNVQETKNIVVLDYDINNINNWYPFIPYNPTKEIPSQYYSKIINTINSTLINSGSAQESTGNKTIDRELVERKYHIDWNKLNDYVISKMEMRLLEELNRNIDIYRSSQNLNTNYNKCNRLQSFLKKYLVLVHEENISNEDNLKLIKSQINEWKEDLEKRIPRRYQVLIRTVHFNTVDAGIIFDVIKHKLNFLDSRESTSIFVTTIKIFQLSSNLFSTYFMIMYSSKIHEMKRNQILIRRHFVGKRINANKKNVINKGIVSDEEEEELENVENMELDKLLVDNDDEIEEMELKLEGMNDNSIEKLSGDDLNVQKKDSKRAMKEDLVDVINKNLKMQTRNFNKLKTKQLNKLSSLNRSESYSGELSSLSSTPISSQSSSSFSSGGDLKEEIERKERNDRSKKVRIDRSDKEEVDLENKDKDELLNMPSYDYNSYTSDSFYDKASILSKSSSILRSILTNMNLYSSDIGSGNSGNIDSSVVSSQIATRSYSRKSTKEGSRVISYRGNTNLHSTLEFSSNASVPFGSSDSSILPMDTMVLKDLNTITSTNTIKTLGSGIKEKVLEPLRKQSVSGLDSKISSSLVSITNTSSDENKNSAVKSSNSSFSTDRISKKESLSSFTSSNIEYPSGGKQPFANKKLLSDSKIVKNKKDSVSIIDNLDQFSNLNSLGLSSNYKSGSDLNVDNNKKDGFFGKGGFLNNIFNTGETSSSSDRIRKNKEGGKDKDNKNGEEISRIFELESSSYFSSMSDDNSASTTNSDLYSENNRFQNEKESLIGLNSIKSKSYVTNSSLKDESHDTSYTFNVGLNSDRNSEVFDKDALSSLSSTPISSSITFFTKTSKDSGEGKEILIKEQKNIFLVYSGSKDNYSKSSTNKSSFKQSGRSANTISDSFGQSDSFVSSSKSKSDFSSISIKSGNAGNHKIGNDLDVDSPLSTTTSNEEVLIEDEYLDNLSFLNKTTKSGSFRKEELMKRDEEVRASKLLAEKLYNSLSISKGSSKYSKSPSFTSSSFTSSSTSNTNGDNLNGSRTKDGDLISYSRRSSSYLSKTSSKNTDSNQITSILSKSNGEFGSNSLIGSLLKNNNSNNFYGKRSNTNDSNLNGSVGLALKSSAKNTNTFDSSSIEYQSNNNTGKGSTNSDLNSEGNKTLSSSTFTSNYDNKDLNKRNTRLYRKVNVYSSFAN